MILRVAAGRALVLAAVLVLGACGGDDGEASEDATGAGAAGADVAADGDGTGTTDAAAGATGDCGDLTAADVETYGFDTQLVAQVVSQAQVDALTSGPLSFSADEFATILADLHTALDGRPGEGFDDPTAAIDLLEDANDQVRAMVEATEPIDQATFDAYAESTGGVTGLLGAQLPINAALSEHCPGILGAG